MITAPRGLCMLVQDWVLGQTVVATDGRARDHRH